MTVIDIVNHCGQCGVICETEDGRLFCKGVTEKDFQVLQYYNEIDKEIVYLYQSSRNLNYYPLLRSSSPDWFEQNTPTIFHLDKEDVPF